MRARRDDGMMRSKVMSMAGAACVAAAAAAVALLARQRHARLRVNGGIATASDSGAHTGGVLDVLSDAAHAAQRQSIAAVTPYYAYKGIERFYDISGFLAQPAVFAQVVEMLADSFRHLDFDSICGLDARGFVLGPPVALALQKPFFMVRKAGKLPNAVTGDTYGKEYEGEDRLSISKRSIKPGDRVLIVDDLVATGGTAKAALDLVRTLGGVAVGFSCVIEIRALGARKMLSDAGHGHVPIYSIVEEELLTLDGASSQ